jgi:hypothetical protein
MRRYTSMIVFVALIANLIAFSIALAGPDRILESKVQTATVAKDKNGAEYVRLVVEDNRNINGIAYTASVPAMCFGVVAEKAKTIKAGQSVKLVASESEFRGKKSFTVMHIVEVK